MTDKQLISEVSLRCGDPEFKDFQPEIYKRAVYRCNREIAKFYGIFKKHITFTLSDMSQSIDDEIILDIPDFKAEYLVDVNGNTLIKVQDKLEDQFRYVYYMQKKEGMLYFNYTLGLGGLVDGQNITGMDITDVMSHSLVERYEDNVYQQTIKSLTDKITILYEIIPNLDTEIGEYDIDTKYEEEQIEKCVYYMAKLGQAKYAGQNEKVQKYDRLYQMCKADKRSDYDKTVAQDSAWIIIKPWSPV